MVRLVFVACFAMLATGCATKEQTYKPPDATKLRAAEQRYEKTITKARQLSVSAHKQTIEARDAAMQMTLIFSTVLANLGDLLAKVPEPLRGSVQTIIDEVKDLQTRQGELITRLNQTTETQTQLEALFVQAERDKVSVLQSAEEYFTNAQGLADDATRENAAAVKAEKALSWYRWHWYLGWIIFVSGILMAIIIAVLKFTGRLALKTAI
jgi:DNA repair exonuclease SbcCD ATPase subunit